MRSESGKVSGYVKDSRHFEGVLNNYFFMVSDVELSDQANVLQREFSWRFSPRRSWRGDPGTYVREMEYH